MCCKFYRNNVTGNRYGGGSGGRTDREIKKVRETTDYLVKDGQVNTVGRFHGVVEAQALLQSGDSFHVASIQGPAKEIKVGLHAALVHTLGDDHNLALNRPAEKDLGSRLAVLLGDLGDNFVLQQGLGVLTGAGHLNVGGRTEGRVGHDLDTLLLDPVDQAGLLEVRVQFDLEDGRLDLAVAEHVQDGLDVEVGDTNVAGLAVFNDLLEFAPAVLDGGAFIGELVLAGLDPAGGRVGFSDGSVLTGDREVDQVQVDVVETQVLELLVKGRADVILVVVGVPQLGDDCKIQYLARCGFETSLAKFNLPNNSSRLTIPSLRARWIPSPTSFSLP